MKNKILLISLLLCIISFASCKDKKLELRLDKLNVTANETLVDICKMFNVTELLDSNNGNITYQLTEIKTKIKSKQVQKILVSGCLPNTTINTTEMCYAWGINKECPYVIGVFTPGMKLKFPKLAGMTFGKGNIEVIQIHVSYLNPEQRAIQDNSGIEMKFTDKHRLHEIGTTIIGRDPNTISIPANETNFTLSDTCNSTCTDRMPSNGISIAGAFLHGHWQLRKIRMNITYANGIIDDTTFRNDNFTFSKQYLKMLKNPIRIKPGDSITIICEYDSTNPEIPTSLEMCMGILYFYEKKDGFLTCGETLGCELYETPRVLGSNTTSFLRPPSN